MSLLAMWRPPAPAPPNPVYQVACVEKSGGADAARMWGSRSSERKISMLRWFVPTAFGWMEGVGWRFRRMWGILRRERRREVVRPVGPPPIIVIGWIGGGGGDEQGDMVRRLDLEMLVCVVQVYVCGFSFFKSEVGDWSDNWGEEVLLSNSGGHVCVVVRPGYCVLTALFILFQRPLMC